LTESRAAWESLERQKPHPGTSDIDNIASAENDADVAKQFLDRVQSNFGVPAPSGVTNSFQFKTLLETRLAALRKKAKSSGVMIPESYAFTFQGQADKLQFQQESLDGLVQQLDEIEKLCDLLFSRNIHSLDGIRRAQVDAIDDTRSADFLPLAIVTNDVAVRIPFELKIKGFSAELASVVETLANSDRCYRVKAYEIERIELSSLTVPPASSDAIAGDDLTSRYGGGGGGGVDPYLAQYGGGAGAARGGKDGGGDRYGGAGGGGNRYGGAGGGGNRYGGAGGGGNRYGGAGGGRGGGGYGGGAGDRYGGRFQPGGTQPTPQQFVPRRRAAAKEVPGELQEKPLSMVINLELVKALAPKASN
jgi:hypothetical protein